MTSPTKLDMAGEAQQLMVMLAMWRELSRTIKPIELPPPPRPKHLGSHQRLIYANTMSSNMFEPFTLEHAVLDGNAVNLTPSYLKAICDDYKRIVDTFIHYVDSICWRVELPDQPVILHCHTLGNRVSCWEILSYYTKGETPGMRLGWLGGEGLNVMYDAAMQLNNELDKSIIYRLRTLEYENQWVPVRRREFIHLLSDVELDDHEYVSAVVVDGWLFLTAEFKYKY